MHMHSLKPEWSILLYVRDLGCVLCLWNLAPLLISKEGYFTLTGLQEIVLLEFQPQPHYQMSNSLDNKSPFYYSPLKEEIRGCWEGQKGSCLSWIEGEEQFLLVSFQSLLEQKLDHHLKTKVPGNFNRTFHLKSCNGALSINLACERLCTDR